MAEKLDEKIPTMRDLDVQLARVQARQAATAARMRLRARVLELSEKGWGPKAISNCLREPERVIANILKGKR